ncbi:MAG: hypothetical protein GEU82_03465 [Luteitalea sp.]|nr:hypothetical protein [Luteitalea sp.]
MHSVPAIGVQSQPATAKAGSLQRSVTALFTTLGRGRNRRPRRREVALDEDVEGTGIAARQVRVSPTGAWGLTFFAVVLTTTNKRALTECIGSTNAIEIIEKPGDLDQTRGRSAESIGDSG